VVISTSTPIVALRAVCVCRNAIVENGLIVEDYLPLEAALGRISRAIRLGGTSGMSGNAPLYLIEIKKRLATLSGFVRE